MFMTKTSGVSSWRSRSCGLSELPLVDSMLLTEGSSLSDTSSSDAACTFIIQLLTGLGTNVFANTKRLQYLPRVGKFTPWVSLESGSYITRYSQNLLLRKPRLSRSEKRKGRFGGWFYFKSNAI